MKVIGTMAKNFSTPQQRIRHLFLAASPSDQRRINYDWELRAIESSFATTLKENVIHRYSVLAVQPRDLQKHLLQIRPHIVHFSGHGTPGSDLCVEGPDGESTMVSMGAWIELFRILGEQVRLVILNACHSSHTAEAVAMYVDCAIGMRGEIDNKTAVVFSEAFYQALGSGSSVKDAYDLGRQALLMSKLGEEQTPLLFCKPGTEPSALYLFDGVQAPLPPGLGDVQAPPQPIKANSSQLRYTEGKIVFVGREAELSVMEQVFVSRAGHVKPVCTIQGMAGVGKTWLAEHFFSQHKSFFDGGIKRLVLDPRQSPDIQACLLEIAKWLGNEAAMASVQIRRFVVDGLRARRAVLHLENVDTEALAHVAAELVGALPCVPILITGRYIGLARDRNAGWTRIGVHPFSEKDALEQLKSELRGALAKIGGSREGERLVRELGYLPLGIRLASGRLGRYGMNRSVSGFLDNFWENLSLKHQDPTMLVSTDRERIDLRSSFEISLKTFREKWGERATQMEAALVALAGGPQAGFGMRLGMVVSGLDTVEAFGEAMSHAVSLSLIEDISHSDCDRMQYRVHPLIRRWLLERVNKKEVNDRIAGWIRMQIGVEPLTTRRERWNVLDEEAAGVGDWIMRDAPMKVVVEFISKGLGYILHSGNMCAWLEAGERVRSSSGRHYSELLGAMGRIALALGKHERALSEAERKINHDAIRGDHLGVRDGWYLKADVLEACGQMEAAQKIRRDFGTRMYPSDSPAPSGS